MRNREQISLCRQRMRGRLRDLAHLTRIFQEGDPLVRGSLYAYRRKCGKVSCRCARGELHQAEAFSIRSGGRPRRVSLAGVDRDKLDRQVGVYRKMRKARAGMVRTFAQLLAVADRLARLREVPAVNLRRGEESPSSI